MLAIGSGLCLIHGWSAAVAERRGRTDLVCLSPQGAVLLHRTTPFYIQHWSGAVISSGRRLALVKGMTWEVWDLAARALGKMDKDVQGALLVKLRHPDGPSDQQAQQFRKWIAQLDDAAYARRKAAVGRLSQDFWLYRPVIEKMAKDSSASADVRSGLKAVLAYHPDGDAAERVAAALASDVGSLVGLFKRLPPSEHAFIAAQLERLTVRKFTGPPAWERWWADIWAEPKEAK